MITLEVIVWGVLGALIVIVVQEVVGWLAERAARAEIDE